MGRRELPRATRHTGTRGAVDVSRREAHLHHSPGTREVIARPRTTRDLHKGARDTVTRLKRKIVDSHSSVAGLFLMRREVLRDGSAHEYLLLPLLPAENAL